MFRLRKKVMPPSSEDQKKMDHLELSRDIPVDEDYVRRAEPNYDDDDGASAWSIASSKYNYHWENGRLYHHYRANHPFPYDDISQENETVLHHLVLLLLNDKFTAAPPNPDKFENVLDVGTGMGLWAEGFAEAYPNCQVLGVDACPREDSVRPNCTFIHVDVTPDWVFDNLDRKFDFIHIRALFASLRPDQWPELYKQALQSMKPGGWIEHTEVEIKVYCDDGTQKENSEIEKVASLTDLMGQAYGTDFRIADSMEQHMKDAGFQDVDRVRLKLPLGPWSTDPKYKEIGKFFERYYMTGLQGWMMHILTTKIQWTTERVNEQVLKAFAEVDKRESHYYFQLVIAAGRKPSEAAETA